MKANAGWRTSLEIERMDRIQFGKAHGKFSREVRRTVASQSNAPAHPGGVLINGAKIPGLEFRIVLENLLL
jgi:hypothetical protein